MATKFLEPGGDADFSVNATNGFWSSIGTGVTASSDIVHANHLRSIKYSTGALSAVNTTGTSAADSGGRLSFFFYMNALPSATSSLMSIISGAATVVARIRCTSTGILQIFNDTTQIGTDGATLATGRWYRISIAYTITSTSVNRFEMFVDGISSISITNATLGNTGSDHYQIGNNSSNATFDVRTSDHYADNSSSLTDTGEIWVTAKRPVANGSANNFTTQIGTGNSGYGTGHSPQVNERPLNTSNGWSVSVSGSAITEEYTIEGAAVGDMNISQATLIDYMGWISANSGTNETATIIVGGATGSISLNSTINTFWAFRGSSVYPTGGTDVGLTTATTTTTVSLYECGVVVAFIPKLFNFVFK